MQKIPLLHRPDRRHLDRPARGARAAAEAPARPRLLVIDYIQLHARARRKSGENRVQEITEITTGLKALAKELDVPIIALSQLSRQVESRDDKRPQLSDLRESGSIEQDADVVMFVYPRGILPQEQGAEARHRRVHQVAGRDGPGRTARPKSSSASSATARPARCSSPSRPSHPLLRPRATRTSCRSGSAIERRFRRTRHGEAGLPSASGGS